MNAANIARALGDASREGRAWRCRCPLHGGGSLVLCDGADGRVLATCFGGCDRRRDLLAELRRRGLFGARITEWRSNAPLRAKADSAGCDEARTARALPILGETHPIERTSGETYLRSRGNDRSEWPATLRYHPRCPHPSGARLPAMVALVEHVERGLVAIHRTFLRADGSGKASIEPAKASLGPVAGGAVHLGMPHAGEWLAITEGIETGLAGATACAIPVWAALSAGGVERLVLPADATRVVICADYDVSGTGQRASHNAAQRWLAEGRHVRIAMPSEPDTDMADLLLAADSCEACHVA